MTIGNDRWEDFWRFVSLDITRPFFADLWISMPDPENFQSMLRLFLREWLQSGTHGSETLQSRITQWIERDQGAEQTHYLRDWLGEFFLRPGARSTERPWLHLCYDTYNRLPKVKSLLRLEFFKALADEQIMRETRLDDRMIVARSQKSEWDSWILTSYGDLTVEGEAAIISLITRGNAFLGLWEKYCGNLAEHDLRLLYHAALRDASNEDAARKIPFPGIWRSELRYFLERADREGWINTAA